MNKRSVLLILIGIIVLGVVLIRTNAKLATDSTGVATPSDSAAGSRYQQCFDERDKAMHREAFATIDNPDVQKEFIATNRDRIREECRREFPD